LWGFQPHTPTRVAPLTHFASTSVLAFFISKFINRKGVAFISEAETQSNTRVRACACLEIDVYDNGLKPLLSFLKVWQKTLTATT